MKTLIYLEDAVEAVSRGCEELRGTFARCEKNLNELPSVQPEKNLYCQITLSDEQMQEAVENAKNEILQVMSSSEPESEERPLTEDDYAYCAECDHVEMCRWYPMYGCEFKSRPSAEPERKTGEWKKGGEQPYFRKHFDIVVCSICNKRGEHRWNYCPNCGAKMERRTK